MPPDPSGPRTSNPPSRCPLESAIRSLAQAFDEVELGKRLRSIERPRASVRRHANLVEVHGILHRNLLPQTSLTRLDVVERHLRRLLPGLPDVKGPGVCGPL